MEAFRAVAKDIGRFFMFRYGLGNKLAKTEAIAISVISVASFVVVFSVWFWG